MAYTSSVTYSGVNNKNTHRLKDIKKAESIANEKAKELIKKNCQEKGVSYESTISDSVSAGLEFMQGYV